MKAKPTVLGLMGVVACFAVGLATVRTNDEYTAAAVFAFTYFILCTGTLFAIYRRGAWAGFAVFGWAQFLICHPNTAPPVGTTSLTNRIAYQLLIRYHGTGQDIPPLSIPEFTSVIDVGDQAFPRVPVEPGPRSDPRPPRPHTGPRPRACLCLSSLLAGLVGAAVGAFVARRSRQSPPLEPRCNGSSIVGAGQAGGDDAPIPGASRDMRRPQFKIAGLMGLVVLAAVGLFTLCNLPVWWSMSLALFANALSRQAWPLVCLAVTLNLAATASVLATKGRARATATGYAAGGWIYLWLSFHVPAFTDFDIPLSRPGYWIALIRPTSSIPSPTTSSSASIEWSLTHWLPSRPGWPGGCSPEGWPGGWVALVTRPPVLLSGRRHWSLADRWHPKGGNPA